MKRISPLLLLSACALLSSCAGGGESSHGGSSLPEPPPVYDDVPPESATPYRGAAACRPVYQILVYSFADSNGDGVGDFQGIVDRLDYLSSLNVGYLWLSPIHPSGSLSPLRRRGLFARRPPLRRGRRAARLDRGGEEARHRHRHGPRLQPRFLRVRLVQGKRREPSPTTSSKGRSRR